MTRTNFTEPCGFTIGPEWFARFNFVNERKEPDIIELIGGDVRFKGSAAGIHFCAARCNYPYIASYTRGALAWYYWSALPCEKFMDLLRYYTYPTEDYMFIGTRDCKTLPNEINYGRHQNCG